MLRSKKTEALPAEALRVRHCEFQGFEAILNNLVLVSVLILAFSMSLLASYTHDDLLEADSRQYRMNGDAISFFFAMRAGICLMTLLLVTTFCTFLNISMHISNAYLTAESWVQWKKFAVPMVLFCMVCFITGLVSFATQATAAYEIAFPR